MTVQGRRSLRDKTTRAPYLLDERSGARHALDVAALKHDLILHVRRALHLGVTNRVNDAHDLLAKEVADLDLAVLVGNGHVNWEVRIHETHLIQEALSRERATASREKRAAAGTMHLPAAGGWTRATRHDAGHTQPTCATLLQNAGNAC